LLEEQRDSTSDPRIRRMRESQLKTVKQDYKRRLQELNIATERGDIMAEAVAFGVIIAKESHCES